MANTDRFHTNTSNLRDAGYRAEYVREPGGGSAMALLLVGIVLLLALLAWVFFAGADESTPVPVPMDGNPAINAPATDDGVLPTPDATTSPVVPAEPVEEAPLAPANN